MVRSTITPELLQAVHVPRDCYRRLVTLLCNPFRNDSLCIRTPSSQWPSHHTYGCYILTIPYKVRTEDSWASRGER